MKFTAIAALVFAALVAAAVAQSCSTSPLLANTQGLSKWVLASPAVVANSFCPSLDQTCCSSELNTFLSETFALYRQYTAEGFKSLNSSMDQVASQIQQQLAYVAEMLKQYANQGIDNIPGTDLSISDLANRMTSIGNIIVNFLHNFAPVYSNCVAAGITYAAGTVCLACDPNSANYVSYNAQTGAFSMQFAQDSCNSLYAGCSKITDAANNLIAQIKNELSGIPDQYTAAYAQAFTANVGMDPCYGKTQAQCQEYYCETVAAGSLASLYSALIAQYNSMSAVADAADVSARAVGADATISYSSSGYQVYSSGSRSTLPLGTKEITGTDPSNSAASLSVAAVATAVVAAAAALF